jgi:hypothetical protein
MGEEEESLEISARKIGREKDSEGHIKKIRRKKNIHSVKKESRGIMSVLNIGDIKGLDDEEREKD